MPTALALLPQLSGNGYYPYSPMSHQYGTKPAIDTISQIARDYYRNERIEIGVGDMSLLGGGTLSGHKSHTNGKCVDIRPIRKDRKQLPVTIHMAEYDRPATELLVQSLLAHYNVQTILFNDTSIRGVRSWPGHDNHLHVKFHA